MFKPKRLPPAHRDSLGYRADIDGLRAIAVLSVIVVHYFPEALKGGFAGVDVFFVISGFLISTHIFEALDQNAFSLADFYARRIRRIFPALLLILCACGLAGWAAMLADEYARLGKHVAAGAGFVANIVFWKEAGYFDVEVMTKPLLHLWSLGVEEQFYFFWPLALWLASKRKVNLLTLGVVLAIVSFILNMKAVTTDAAGAFHSPATRMWELLCGAILASVMLDRSGALASAKARVDGWLAPVLFSDKRPADGKTLADVLSFVGLVWLLFGLWRIHKNLEFPGLWAAIPVASSMMLILAGPQAWANRVILSNRILVFFGLISFPLYLWHWPLLSFLRITESETPGAAIRVALIGLSIALAWVTWRFVEQPVRLARNGKAVAIVLAALMGMVGAAGYFVFANDGFPARPALAGMSENYEATKGFHEDDPVSHAQCMESLKAPGPIRYCNLSGATPPRIAIIGDSHGRALFKGLKDDLAARNESLLQIGGRLYLDLLIHARGNDFERNVSLGGVKATQFVSDAPSIETVIMVSHGDKWLRPDPNFVFQMVSRPDVTDRREIFETVMRTTLNSLVANRKEIVFVIDNPTLSFDPRACLDVRPIRLIQKTMSPCAMSRTQYEKDASDYRDLVFGVLKDYPTVKIFDAAARLCDDTWCWASKDGKILYTDQHHLSPAGARLLSRELVNLIAVGDKRGTTDSTGH